MYDKFQQLAFDAEFSICLIGNLQTSDFELVDVADLPLSEDHRSAMRARGKSFLGVAALVGGVPHTALAAGLDIATIYPLARACLAHFATVLDRPAKPTDDAARWLAELYA